MKKIYAYALIIFLLPFFTQPVQAEDYIQAKLLSAVRSVGAAESFEAALAINLTEGWHTYWRVPGDAGLAPVFDWSASENIARVEISYPAPLRKQELGFRVFGYKESVTFPLVVYPENPDTPVILNLNLTMMVCKDICIPQTVHPSLSLPAGDGYSSDEARLIDLAKREIPVKGDSPKLRIDTAVAGPDGLVLSVFSHDGFENFDAFAVFDDQALTAPPEIILTDNDPRTALVKIPAPIDVENFQEFTHGKTLNVTVVSGKNAIEKDIDF